MSVLTLLLRFIILRVPMKGKIKIICYTIDMSLRHVHPFDPILFCDTKILILGTFPSLDSFKYNFYYAHARNQFWKILSAIFDMPVVTKEEKITLLREKKIGLWDIVASCERKNSSDTNLKNCVLNDIPLLLRTYQDIQLLAFTGQKAAQLYHRQYADLSIETVTLPSPSPAYAKMRITQKLEIYRNCLL